MTSAREIAVDDYAAGFMRRLDAAIKRSGLTDRRVSILAGDSYGKLVSRIRSQGNVPTLGTVQTLALILGVTVDYLAGMPGTDVQVSCAASGRNDEMLSKITSVDFSALDKNDGHFERPSIETILNWWRQSDRRLSDTGGLIEFCDVYRRPTPERMFVQPVALGERSLAAGELDVTNPEELRREFAQMPEPAVRQVISWHIKTRNEGILLSEETLAYKTARDAQVNVRYWRLLLPVIGPDGQDEFVLCYARPFETSVL